MRKRGEVRGRGKRGKGREGKGRGGEDPPEKFPSYATGLFSVLIQQLHTLCSDT